MGAPVYIRVRAGRSSTGQGGNQDRTVIKNTNNIFIKEIIYSMFSYMKYTIHRYFIKNEDFIDSINL